SMLELENAKEFAISTRTTVATSAAPAAIAAPRVHANTRSRFSTARKYSLKRSNGFMLPLYRPIDADFLQLFPPPPATRPPAAHTTKTNACYRDWRRPHRRRSRPPD